MFIFEITICALIAIFGVALIVCDVLFNRFLDIEDEVNDYGNE